MIFIGIFVAFVLVSLHLPIFSLADTVKYAFPLELRGFKDSGEIETGRTSRLVIMLV